MANPRKFAERRAPLTSLVLPLLMGGLALTPAQAVAQAIERNLPPVPQARPAAPLAPNALPAEQDATPLGANLAAIVLLGPKDAVAAPRPGVAVDAGRVPRLADQRIAARLQPFVGQPLSRKLIAQVEAEIARYYREAGYPFVALSTPEQELTGGVLQIRVVEFVAGAVSVRGVDGPTAERVRRGVRLEPGQPISSDSLSQDLDWQNRNPFRTVGAQFAPGDGDGQTDLELVVAPSRPWRVYGGYTNSGAPSTGRDRVFVGALVGNLPLDAVLSYQLTASPDFFYDSGKLFGGDSDYISHGARLTVPTGARQQLELTLSSVDTHAPAGDFTIAQKTREATLGYREALSNFVRAPGDVVAGVELKAQSRDVFFGDTRVLAADANIYQVFAEWDYDRTDALGRTSVQVGAHASPGGLGDRNSDARFDEFSFGRTHQSRYAYGTFNLTRATRLPGGLSLINSLSGQYASQALPQPAQVGLGGQGAVRIYTADDGSFDRAVILRNELRLNGFGLLPAKTGVTDRLSPYVFADLGYGEDLGAHKTSSVAAVGAGVDYQAARNVSLSLDGGRALRAGQGTKSGDWRLEAALTLTF